MSHLPLINYWECIGAGAVDIICLSGGPAERAGIVVMTSIVGSIHKYYLSFIWQVKRRRRKKNKRKLTNFGFAFHYNIDLALFHMLSYRKTNEPEIHNKSRHVLSERIRNHIRCLFIIIDYLQLCTEQQTVCRCCTDLRRNMYSWSPGIWIFQHRDQKYGPHLC